MQNQMGWIFLPDPLSDGRRFGSLSSQMQKEFENTETLIFDEDGRFLSRLRTALQGMRGRCRKVGVAAEGHVSGAAVSLAAQLPVDEILLMDSRIFTPGERKTKAQRQLARIAGFARRNLSLVVADAVLVDCAPAELRRLLRFLVNGSVRIVHSGPEGMDNLWRKDESCTFKPRSIFKTPGVYPK